MCEDRGLGRVEFLMSEGSGFPSRLGRELGHKGAHRAFLSSGNILSAWPAHGDPFIIICPKQTSFFYALSACMSYFIQNKNNSNIKGKARV